MKKSSGLILLSRVADRQLSRLKLNNYAELTKQGTFSLELANMGLHDDDLDVLIEAIKQNAVFTRLSLRNYTEEYRKIMLLLPYRNKLTLADGKLADAIAKNTTLKSLWLGGNNIDPEGIKHLANALKVNNTLQILHLYNNNIGDEEAKYIADMLDANETLQQLWLHSNNIGIEGVKHLAAALKKNNTLEKLHLGSNNIGDEGAKYIADMLVVNKTLQEIGLNSNNIGDKGAESIAASLAVNMGLHQIWLHANKFGNQGAEKLAEAIKSLSYKNIGDEGMKKIKAALNDPRRKQVLKPLTDQEKKEMGEFLKRQLSAEMSAPPLTDQEKKEEKEQFLMFTRVLM